MPHLAYQIIIDKDAGLRIKEIRKALKMGQVDFAELCEISQPMITRIELGDKEIPYRMIKALQVKRNVNPSFIFIGSAQPMFLLSNR